MNILLRLSPFHVPVSRRTAEAVNSLINTVLHSKNTNILNMNTATALAVIETAKNAFTAVKKRNAELASELTALRDQSTANTHIVEALNAQIEKLDADDAAIDAALADLAGSVDPAPGVPATGTPAEEPAPAPTADGTTSDPA